MKYKKNKIKSLFAALCCITLMAVTYSCDQLDEEFNNPDEITEARLDLFFTESLKKGHLFRLDYGPSYHHINNFCREMGLGANVYYSFSSLGSGMSAQQYWTNWSGAAFQKEIFERTGTTYTVNINGMTLLYNAMSESEKQTYEIFMLCSRIMKGYAFQRSADLYDDVPYFEAGGAFEQKFYPAFDTQEEIYDAILADLDEVSTRLKVIIDGGGISAGSKMLFNTADLLNGGDVDKWLRFSNSLQLRMALRLVHVKPEVSKSLATKLITEDRLITDIKHEVLFSERDQSPTAVSQDLFFRAFEEMGHVLAAPQFILEDILHADAPTKHGIDPRLYVLFQSNRDNQYVGYSYKMDDSLYYRKFFPESKFNKTQFRVRIDSIAKNLDIRGTTQEANDGSGSNWYTQRLTAKYNRATFLNYEIKFPVFQSNEVNLLIAEAALRWPDAVSTDQAARIKSAIDASTRYYYNLNMSNKYSNSTSPAANFISSRSRMGSLDEAHLAAYLNTAATAYNALDKKGKLKFIFHQKYVHNSILYPYESFSEARRIIKDLDGEIPVKIMTNYFWWERLRYPPAEATDNKDNYAKVAAKNRVSLPVWWTGRTVAAVNPNASPGVNLVTTE